MSFANIKGQDYAIQLLKGHMQKGRVASAYLFVGPEGIGKGLVARTFAKALNCEKSGLDSCDSCISCMKIDKTQHPDMHFLGADQDSPDSIKIEEVRQLQRQISLHPYEARKKIFVLDNAHTLTPEASNALLKVLEEPPGESVIILTTHKPSLLFKTIISRTQVIKLYPLTAARLEAILKKDYGVSGVQAHFVSCLCEGSIGKALRLKDAGLMSLRDAAVDGFILHKAQADTAGLSETKEDIRDCLNMLAAWFRDIYFVKIGMPDSQIINIDRRLELWRLTNSYTFADLDKAFKAISETLLYLEQNINPKLLLTNLRWSLKG